MATTVTIETASVCHNAKVAFSTFLGIDGGDVVVMRTKDDRCAPEIRGAASLLSGFSVPCEVDTSPVIADPGVHEVTSEQALLALSFLALLLTRETFQGSPPASLKVLLRDLKLESRLSREEAVKRYNVAKTLSLFVIRGGESLGGEVFWGKTEINLEKVSSPRSRSTHEMKKSGGASADERFVILQISRDLVNLHLLPQFLAKGAGSGFRLIAADKLDSVIKRMNAPRDDGRNFIELTIRLSGGVGVDELVKTMVRRSALKRFASITLGRGNSDVEPNEVRFSEWMKLENGGRKINIYYNRAFPSETIEKIGPLAAFTART